MSAKPVFEPRSLKLDQLPEPGASFTPEDRAADE
jgi:hypothetical protein